LDKVLNTIPGIFIFWEILSLKMSHFWFENAFLSGIKLKMKISNFRIIFCEILFL